MSALPPTEGRHAASRGLDQLPTAELVDLLVRDQSDAVAAVRAQSATIARVVDAIALRMRAGGRLHYVGAGTSGRLGVLDASEMPPTFGVLPDVVCAHIAGGEDALRRSVEGAEDDASAGDEQMRDHIRDGDAVVGISASGGAAFVVAALERARVLGAFTVAITSVDASALVGAADEAIVAPTGAEIVAGSTRLKAGTAQKIALNAISTAVMVRLGKVYDNLMVDVVGANQKLRSRALRLVRELTDCDERSASDALRESQGGVKVAVVMLLRGVNALDARSLLEAHGGRLRDVLALS